MIMAAMVISAQVTTSALGGRVVFSNTGEEAIGVTVTAKHRPSGSQYQGITNFDGSYSLSGLRAGGPYELTFSYIGYQTKCVQDIQLPLGQTIIIDTELDEEDATLAEVLVVAHDNLTMRADRSGTVTSIDAQRMSVMPSIGRSVADLIRITPQSSAASGLSIGGGNYRQSSVTIDGASFNDAFGLGTTLMPGGGTPISLDAIEQMTVSITPYDVRQSGFTGGGVNAVTKSGTNEFKGSLYSYLTSNALKGKKVGDVDLKLGDGHTNTYGLTFGGPIIKDKLFFFINGEIEDNVAAGPLDRAGNGSTPYSTTNHRPQLSELQSLSDYLLANYGINTGAWQGFNAKSPTYRILARIDWNINANHKFNVRFNNSNRKVSNSTNSSRSMGGNQATAIYGGNQNAYGTGSYYCMNSLSSRFFSEYRFTSLAAELNSQLGKVHNTLRATYSFQDQPRSNEFGMSVPVVEVVMDDGQGHFPAWAQTGDIFTYGNLTQTKTTVITDEVNLHLGKHNLFAGIQYEHNYAVNQYAPTAAGYYVFEASQQQVSNGEWASVFNAKPRFFAITYGNGTDHSIFKQTMSTNQWSLYLQDNMTLNDNLRLSAGLRMEWPSYPSLDNNFNPGFYSIDFGGKHFRTDNLPGNSVSLSPRLGFNWDITGQRKYILRGGTGLFVGRIPFVWLLSAVGNSGMGQTTYIATQANGKTMPSLTTNQDEMLQQIGATSEIKVPAEPTILADDLQRPMSWKASLAFDAKLPGDIDFTVEGVMNRDLNPVVVTNGNVYWDGSSTIDLGHGDIRHKMSTYRSQADYPDLQFTSPGLGAYVLENAGAKAYYMSLTFQLHKAFDFGLDLTASYTLSKAKTYTEGIGNQVSASYGVYRYSVNGVNENERGYATFVAPGRLLLALNYKLNEGKNASSTFSLLYDGYQYGFLGNYSFSRYSYIFSSNVVGDPSAPGNLIYVPASREELENWDFKDNGTVDGQVYTAQMQRDDFWTFIQQDDYLKNRKGMYAERGGAKMPWHHQLDFKFMQEFYLAVGKTKNTLQLGVDIINLPNLLCKDWGVFKQVTHDALLSYSSDGKYTYNLANGERHTKTFQNFQTLSSTYQVMFTLRYIFN